LATADEIMEFMRKSIHMMFFLCVFQQPLRKTWQGRCLAILRLKGNAGGILPTAEVPGLKSATIVIQTR